MPARKATLYRMVLPDHVCPYGVHARQLLDQAGFEVEEHILATRMEVDAFEDGHGVSSTPQIFIDGKRVGGCDDLEHFLAVAEAQS